MGKHIDLKLEDGVSAEGGVGSVTVKVTTPDERPKDIRSIVDMLDADIAKLNAFETERAAASHTTFERWSKSRMARELYPDPDEKRVSPSAVNMWVKRNYIPHRHVQALVRLLYSKIGDNSEIVQAAEDGTLYALENYALNLAKFKREEQFLHNDETFLAARKKTMLEKIVSAHASVRAKSDAAASADVIKKSTPNAGWIKAISQHEDDIEQAKRIIIEDYHEDTWRFAGLFPDEHNARQRHWEKKFKAPSETRSFTNNFFYVDWDFQCNVIDVLTWTDGDKVRVKVTPDPYKGILHNYMHENEIGPWYTEEGNWANVVLFVVVRERTRAVDKVLEQLEYNYFEPLELSYMIVDSYTDLVRDLASGKIIRSNEEEAAYKREQELTEKYGDAVWEFDAVGDD